MTKIVCMFALFALLSGCAAGRTEPAEFAVAGHSAYESGDGGDWFSPRDPAAPDDPAVSDMFRKIADTALGTPYARGGTTMSGFDCSGFVQWTYSHMGISLPRTAREQSRVGRPVSSGDLRTGDIVAFRHPRRGWHSGIYMGNDQFVHSPSRRQRVRYSSMSDPYFRDTFVAARRVVRGDADLDVEAADRRLALAQALAGSEKSVVSGEPARKTAKKGKGRTRAAKAGGKKTGKAKAVAAKTGKSKPGQNTRMRAGKKDTRMRAGEKTTARKSASAGTGEKKKTSPRKG